MEIQRRKMKKKNNNPTKQSYPYVNTTTWFLIVSLFSILIRLSVSLHPYSGAATPPKFGDYEAQRHWMEITINLPITEWYRNTTSNDLTCWGLDYPPLTACQSYLHGFLLSLFDPNSVHLFDSRGYESYIGCVFFSSYMTCVLISSNALVITGIDDRRYWTRIPAEEPRFNSIAYLQQIWWFEVDGEIEFPFPAGTYSLLFRLQLGRPHKRFGRIVCNSEHVHGWDKKPVQFQLSTSDGQKATKQCYLKEQGRWIYYQ